MGNGKGLGIDGIGGEVYKAIVRCKWPRDGKGLACILLRVLIEWEHTRGLDDFDGSVGTEEGRFEGHEQFQRFV